jgi:hypothetical protein
MDSALTLEDRMIVWGASHPWVGYLLVFAIFIWACARMIQEWERRKADRTVDPKDGRP